MHSPPKEPLRGDVWWVDLDPVRDHEEGGRRPGLILSATTFNRGPSGIVVVCPVTRTERRVRFHVAIDPPEGGLRARSFVLCDQPRAISIERIAKRIGSVSPTTLALVEMRLRILFGL